MQFRDLKTQYITLKEKIDNEMIKVAASSAYIMGPQVKELEASLAEYVGVKHCITCANGTDALTLSLMSWDIGPGDAVFVPDFTFFASAEVVSLTGATPVFVDVDEDTFNLSPKEFEKSIIRVKDEGRLKPKAVIPVDLFGLPANYPEIKYIAGQHGLYILEDGAQGFGGRIKDKMACSFGDISTTSFFPAKPLGCYGDGGAIFTDIDEWAEKIKSLKVHGKGLHKYDNVRIGMNSRLDTIQAAILQVKLDAFKEYELDDVNKAAAIYTENLKDIIKTPAIPEGYYSSWAQYTITLKSAEQRDGLQEYLKGKGIPTMIYYLKPMHLQTAFSNLGQTDIYTVTNKLCNCVLSLPMHPYLTKDEINIVSSHIFDYQKNNRFDAACKKTV